MADNLGDLIDKLDLSPEACRARMEARAAPFRDFITFDKKARMFDLVWPGRDTYSFHASDVSSTKDVVRWLAHLSEKPWVTSKHLAGFVTLVDIHIGLYTLVNKETPSW